MLLGAGGGTSIEREMNLTTSIAMLKSTMLMLNMNPTTTMMIMITLTWKQSPEFLTVLLYKHNIIAILLL